MGDGRSTMMNILDIPEEVILGYFLPVLKLTDLLRFRRVCKLTNDLVQEYMRSGKIRKWQGSSEIEIGEGKKSLSTFLGLRPELKFPTTCFYINNTNEAFFEDPLIPAFLEKYGNQITHLRVRNFNTCTSEKEMEFYEGFSYLEVLGLEEIDARRREVEIVTVTTPDKAPILFPSTFQNLKGLKLGLVHRPPNDYGYVWELIEFCGKLAYVSHPKFTFEEYEEGEVHPSGDFGCVTGMIMKRARETPTEPNLRFYDLQNFQVCSDYYDSTSFFQLLEQCFQLDVYLLNADALLFADAERHMTRYQYSDMIMFPLVSVRNLHASHLSLMEALSLEEVVIEATSMCSLSPGTFYLRPRWSSLKKLDITIDSKFLGWFENYQAYTKDLLGFLFCVGVNRNRRNLTDLSLTFKEHNRTSLAELPCPRASSIVTAVPNLTKFKITNWPGTNKALSVLWNGQSLPLLEDIYIEDCTLLGNSAFVGENIKNPTLLTLKGLKKLTLKGLDKMPKITDTVFRLVFRHLKLAQFYLGSSEPIKNITADGIRTLQTGEFAKSIEKFPFQGWSLFGVCDENFNQLGSEFRSSEMI